MSQSTPKRGTEPDKQQSEQSFDSILDIDGQYRDTAKVTSTSSSDSSTSADDSDNERGIVLTPSATKLVPRPARLQERPQKEQSDNASNREMQNMLSLWEAQR